AGSRPHRPRRLPVRAARADRGRHPRAARRRATAQADPPRVVRVLSRKGTPMRRVILAICATAAGLVLLLSFKTHTQSGAAVSAPAAALGSPSPGPAGGGAAAATPAPAGSGPVTAPASPAAGSATTGTPS